MARPTREQIDEDILDTAALMFARHGFAHTSVQRIADATGYSKTGLLHRFPTKDALQDAAAAATLARIRRIVDRVRDEPLGPGRDRLVVEDLVDLTAARPGFVALLLTAASTADTEDFGRFEDLGQALFTAFSGPDAGLPEADAARSTRIVAAVGGMALASLAFRDQPPHALRPLLVTAALGALGSAEPSA